jgi:hypothetical protein
LTVMLTHWREVSVGYRPGSIGRSTEQLSRGERAEECRRLPVGRKDSPSSAWHQCKSIASELRRRGRATKKPGHHRLQQLQATGGLAWAELIKLGTKL